MAKLPQSRVLPSVRRWLVAMLTRIAVVIEMSMVDSAAGRKAIVREIQLSASRRDRRDETNLSPVQARMFQGLADFEGTTFRTLVNG